MLRLFIAFEIEKIRKYFAQKKLAKLITTGLFFCLFLFLGVGMYHFFTSSFRYINTESESGIRLALLLFLYESFLLVLAGLLVLSTIITSLFSLFKGKNNNWIISSPAYGFFPRSIFIRSLISSSFILLIMFLPAFLAIASVYTLNAFSLVVILLSVLLFSLLLNASTLLGIVLVAYVYYLFSKLFSKNIFSFGGFTTLLVVVTAGVLLFVWRVVRSVDLMGLFKGNETDGAVSLQSMAAHFTLLPTHPFAMEIMSLQNNDVSAATTYFLIMLTFAILTTGMWWHMSKMYYPLWQKFQESTPVSIDNGSPHIPYRFSGSIMKVLFKKELLITTRNLKGVLWFFFLLSIWLMQLAANVLLNHNIQKYQDDISPRMISLQMIQYIVAVYFISSFTLRFVFPSFSTERKTKWILGSAPISFKKVFMGKYFFFTSFFVCIGLLMNYCNSYILQLNATHTLYSLILFISVIIFIVTLGLTFGALFPNTETDDPEIISTSMPGLFFTAIALTYGGLSDGVLYLVLKHNNFLMFYLFMFITGLAVFLMVYYVTRIVAKGYIRT